MIEIMKNIYWVGVKDWELKKFHGEEFTTRKGSSYNAYLLKDEKTVLVDTAWLPFDEDFVAGLEDAVDLKKIDCIVSNHSEVDHSGALKLLLSKIPGTPVYCTANGAKMLKKHYHEDWNFQVVKTGDTLKTGAYELLFIEAPMLHWPDSMFTYVKGANLLLSNDAFGQHYASSALYNDQVDQCELFQEALTYYANILTPFSRMVRQKIDQFKSLNLPVEMIAPSHGVIWRKDPLQIVDKYYQWAGDYQEDLVAIIYDSMWDGTKKMAYAIGEGLRRQGVDYKIIHAGKRDHTEIIAEAFKAKALLLGSSTINGGILSGIAAVMETIKGMKFKNKAGSAFGSYGWSGESVKILTQGLEDAGIKVVKEGIRLQYQPTGEELAQCAAFGEGFAREINA